MSDVTHPVVQAAIDHVERGLAHLNARLSEPHASTWVPDNIRRLARVREAFDRLPDLAPDSSFSCKMNFDVREYEGGGGSYRYRTARITADHVELEGGRITSDGEAAAGASDVFKIVYPFGGEATGTERLGDWIGIWDTSTGTREGPYC
jgi:hypothetical protein